MKKMICAAVLLLSASFVRADDATVLPDKFIALVATANYSQAIDAVFVNETNGGKNDVSEEFKSSSASFFNSLGPYKHHELVDVQSMGTRWKKLFYLVAFRDQPLLIVFKAYKPDNSWQVLSYSYATTFDIKNGHITYRENR